MIEISGRTDVQIEIVGSRAGEKMHEELWNDDEQVSQTAHPKIQRAARAPLVVVIVPLCATFRDWPRAVSTHFVPPVLRGRTLFEKRRPSVT